MMLSVVATTLWLALPVSGFRASTQHSLRGGEVDDTAYTLVQYRGLGCSGDKYVCQHVTKGSCSVTTAQDGGVSFQVHTQLDENADGSFTVKACEKAGCDCSYTQEYTANTCKGGTYAGSSLSYQLVPGEVEGCVTYDFDVAGGRHHDAYESAMGNSSAATDDADASTLLQHTKVDPQEPATDDAKAPLMDVGGPVVKEQKAEEDALVVAPSNNEASFFHDWAGNAPAPEQGFEGDNVEHVDQKTVTGDWGGEYGPKKSSAALFGAVLVALVAA